MKRLFCVVSFIGALGGMLGCAVQPSRVEMDFGTSCKLAIANQVLMPQAGQNTAPVEGLDGETAQRVYDRYIKQFEGPEKEPAYVLTTGAQGSPTR